MRKENVKRESSTGHTAPSTNPQIRDLRTLVTALQQENTSLEQERDEAIKLVKDQQQTLHRIHALMAEQAQILRRQYVVINQFLAFAESAAGLEVTTPTEASDPQTLPS